MKRFFGAVVHPKAKVRDAVPTDFQSANVAGSSVTRPSWLLGLGGRLARGMLRLENAVWEHKLGVSTHGTHNWQPGDWSQAEHLYYFATSYRRIFRILDTLQLGSSDVFVDLGCGKGRVTCCASLYSVGEVIGIEDVGELCAVAEKNLKRLRGKRAQARILHGKAEEFDYTSGSVIYMFNPFGPKTLATVLSKLEQGLRRNPRCVRVVYVNPVHKYIFNGMDWLELYDQWPASRCLGTEITYPVAFWKSQIGDRLYTQSGGQRPK